MQDSIDFQTLLVSFLIPAFHRYPWFSFDVDLGVQIHTLP